MIIIIIIVIIIYVCVCPVLPLAVVNGFSLYWYWFDERVCEAEGMCYRLPRASLGMWAFRLFAHLCLQASILR